MKYRPSLDGLRAVAVSAVIMFHFYSPYFRGGWAGVDIFFVLSGFLISKILLDEINVTGQISFRKFYIRRCLRLIPAFYCLVIFLVALSFLSKHHQSDYLKEIVFSVTYLMNWERAFCWLPGDGGILGHTWSLAIEEQFYLIWPAILMFLWRKGKLSWRITLSYMAFVILWRVYLVAGGAEAERTYNGFDTHSDTLVIGCTLALVDVPISVTYWAKRLELLPVTVMMVVFIFLPYNIEFTQMFGLTAIGFLTAWILLAAFDDGYVSRFLSNRPLVYTGKISYGWYLWHFPIIFLASGHITKLERPFIMVLSYVVASLSYHFVETPFLNMKKCFEVQKSNYSPISRHLLALEGVEVDETRASP